MIFQGRDEMFSLAGKRAVVTGAGSGSGAAIAVRFARAGAAIAVLDIDREAAARVAAGITGSGGAADPVQCDVADAASVEAVFAAQTARIDIVVNSAGIAHVGTIVQTTEADFDRLFAVNVRGTFLCAQAAVRHMLDRGGGVILNMASITALVGVADRFAYSMTKGAVHTMTMSIAIDYMQRNIRCNCLCPARIHTPFVDRYLAQHYPGREAEMFAQLSAYQPIGRMGTPEEVAALAHYLCSDEASFVTGQAYPIDGGVLVT
jgi:NAD(P)-dependent dehydrogenase (short-subunit alcohol dehydrogenase family)